MEELPSAMSQESSRVRVVESRGTTETSLVEECHGPERMKLRNFWCFLEIMRQYQIKLMKNESHSLVGLLLFSTDSTPSTYNVVFSEG